MTIPVGYNFTERLRQSIQLARGAASRLHHERVTPVHIALGILEEGEGVAATALRFHGIALDDVERDLIGALGEVRATPESPHEPGLSEETESLLDAARNESRELGHPYVGSEHVLLGLLRDVDSIPAQLLERRGFSYADAKARVSWILGSDPFHPEPYAGPQ